MKQTALDTRQKKKEQQLTAAKQIIGSCYRDYYPNELFNLLSCCGNYKSLVESNVRVALKEMMQRRYNTLKEQHTLLGIHPLRADEAFSSTEVQVRDAIHHYIKMNDISKRQLGCRQRKFTAILTLYWGNIICVVK